MNTTPAGMMYIQNILGSPIYSDGQYDIEYIVGAIVMIMTIWLFYKLILKLTDNLAHRR